MKINQHHSHARRWLSRSSVGVTVACSLLAVACGSAEDGSSEDTSVVALSQQSLAQHYDGETLLRGVFFGRGPVADLLPEIWGKAPVSKEAAAEAFRSGMAELSRTDSEQEADERVFESIVKGDSRRQEAADEVCKVALARLTEQDPRFIEYFEKSMYSGDPILVSDAIEEAAKRLSELLEIEIISDPGRYGADWVVNENVVINVNAALNVNVAVNIDTAYNKTQFWSRGLDRESMLRNQVMVATITERFAS